MQQCGRIWEVSRLTGDVDFMIHGIFSYELFGHTVWITTSHVCIFIVMLSLLIFAIVANRSLAHGENVPTGFQNVVELVVEKLDGMVEGTRMVYGGAAFKTERVPLGTALVVVGAGAFEPVELAASSDVADVDFVRAGIRFLEKRPRAASSVNLAAAKCVVGVGRGLGSADISTVTCKSTPFSPKASETASVSAVLKTKRNNTAQISPFSGLKF